MYHILANKYIIIISLIVLVMSLGAARVTNNK
jgi:hypothetical protein